MKAFMIALVSLIAGAGADQLIMRHFGSESLSRDKALIKEEFARHLLSEHPGNKHPLFIPTLVSDTERIQAFVKKYQSVGR